MYSAERDRKMNLVVSEMRPDDTNDPPEIKSFTCPYMNQTHNMGSVFGDFKTHSKETKQQTFELDAKESK
jgi:hypothetical protein